MMHVTRGTTTAVTSNFSLEERVDETVKVARDCTGDVCVKPATPDIVALNGERGRHSD